MLESIARRRLIGIFSLVSLLFCGSSFAQDKVPLKDIQARSVKYDERFVVSPDGRMVATYRTVTKALKEDALPALRQRSIQVSKSAQKLKVLEAYTLKADGRKIQVPPSSWQIRQDTGRPGQSPIFSDYSSTTLVFPDLAVGDSVVLSYQIDTLEPYFPGKISLAEDFSPAYAYDDVRIVVDAPADMRFSYSQRGMKETVEKTGNRQRINWTWQNPEPVRSDRTDWSVYDVESRTGYMFSTFDSWSEIAKSYASRAYPKAAVTPLIKERADDIIKGAASDQEKVRLIYEWVAKEISYAGNCVGIGAVVPRDLEVVLKHRMGDCKDHATLLQALLAAENIRSEQVLVNAGSVYRLPSVPVVSVVNHVINWVPSLSLFLDSTSDSTVFGRLPLSDQQKPILAADSAVPTVTPADPGGNTQQMKTKLTLKDNGDVEGEVHVVVSGAFSESSRSRFRQLNKDYATTFVRDSFRGIGLDAEGELRYDDARQLNDRYQYSAKFRVKSAYRYPGSGALGLGSWFYSEAPIAALVQQATMPVEPYDSACWSARSTEEFEITIPEGMQILAIPNDTAFSSPLVAYESTYKLIGRVLTVTRSIEDRTKGNICAPETTKTYREALKVVWNDLRQQMLYR